MEDIVVSGEEGVTKPDRRIYETLLERAGIEPRASVFIDERQNNVSAAEELGFTGIVFRDADGLEEELARLGLVESSAKR